MNILKKIFRIKEKKTIVNKMDSNAERPELAGLEKFKSKNSNDRMRDIMILGNTGNSKAFEIIEYAILNDQNSDVVMAGLKRLSIFKDDERLSPLLEKLKVKDDIKKYEPYYSMTLLNLGLISESEFNKIFEG